MCVVCVFVCVCVCVYVYVYVYVYVCVCVCVSIPWLVITSVVIWHDMDPVLLVKNKVYSFYMAAVVEIVSDCSIKIEVRCRN